MSVNGGLSAASHIPAWKRLGLKLKRDDHVPADSPSAAVNGLETDEHRTHEKKRHQEHVTNGRSEKRRKTGIDSLSVPNAFVNSELTSQRPHKARKDVSEHSTTQGAFEASVKTPRRAIPDDVEGFVEYDRRNSEQSPDKQSSRRKSVTFTPDTKTEDGVSASNLFKAWSAEQSSDSNIDPALSAEEPQALPTPTKKEKKKSKSKTPVQAGEVSISQSTTSTSNNVPAYVSYLTQFHQDRGNWKFNKNKQTDLLKHLFSLEHFPSEHTPALAAYVAGLQGTSARQRLHEQATAILDAFVNDPANQPTDAIPPKMDTPEQRKVAWDAAFARYLERAKQAKATYGGEWETPELEELDRKAERGERAEAVLRELLPQFLHPEQYQGGAKANEGVAGKSAALDGSGVVTGRGEKGAENSETRQQKKKKRKSRTEVVDESSGDSTISSDSSSSSSSSSDDSSADDSSEGGGSDDDGRQKSSGDSGSPGKGAARVKSKRKPIFDKALLDRKFGKK